MKLLRPWFALSLLPLFLVVLTGACSSATSASEADVSGPSQASKKGPLAADFSVNTGGESAFSLSDHRGEIVVLFFSFPG